MCGWKNLIPQLCNRYIKAGLHPLKSDLSRVFLQKKNHSYYNVFLSNGGWGGILREKSLPKVLTPIWIYFNYMQIIIIWGVGGVFHLLLVIAFNPI